MKQYDTAQPQSHISELVKLALRGEEIIIARDNKSLLRLSPNDRAQGKRKPGSGKKIRNAQ